MGVSDIDPNNFHTVGDIGVALYGCYLALVAWRTIVTLRDEPFKVSGGKISAIVRCYGRKSGESIVLA